MLAILSASISEKCLDASAEMLDKCIDKIAEGDRDALADIYRATSKSVYGFALSILKNTYDAQDVMQDCYINIYSAAHLYRSEGKPMAWILTITRNLSLKLLRERSRFVGLPDDDLMSCRQDVEELPDDDRLMLSMCMKVLSDEERQIVVLHAVSGLKHREIASILGMSLPTVLSKYNRAIKKLKNAWETGA